jgi:hypothetical protein
VSRSRNFDILAPAPAKSFGALRPRHHNTAILGLSLPSSPLASSLTHRSTSGRSTFPAHGEYAAESPHGLCYQTSTSPLNRQLPKTESGIHMPRLPLLLSTNIPLRHRTFLYLYVKTRYVGAKFWGKNMLFYSVLFEPLSCSFFRAFSQCFGSESDRIQNYLHFLIEINLCFNLK